MTAITGGILGPLAFELYAVAPYAELERGNATFNASVKANYVVLDPYNRLRLAWRNHKFGPITLAIACFLAIFMDTAASRLIGSRNIATTTYMPQAVQVLAPLGIAPSPDGTDGADGSHIFLSSVQCLSAALFAGGQQLYKASPVPYSYYGLEGNWSITPLKLILPSYDLPALGHRFNTSTISNLTVETFGIDSNANCKLASITFRDNVTITATVDQCSADFLVSTDENFPRWHNATSIPCNDASKIDAGFRTFVYGVYRTSGYAARDPNQFLFMFCQPSISISKVFATMSVTNDGQIGALVAPPIIIESYPIGSNTSEPGVNRLLGPPLNGNALNGYDIPEPKGTENYSRSSRVVIVKSILYEGIYGAQRLHMFNDLVGTDTDWFSAPQRVRLGNIASDFYQAYVSTFSRSVYYDLNTTTTTMIDGKISTTQTRAMISRLNMIALQILLFLSALLLAITLIQQPTPHPQGLAVEMSRSTIWDHLQVAHHLLDYFRRDSHLPRDEIERQISRRRFSIHERQIVVVDE